MDRTARLAKLKEKWLKGMGAGIAFTQDIYDYIDGKTPFPSCQEAYIVGRCYGYRESLPKAVVAELKGDLRPEACRMLYICALSRRNVGLVQTAQDIETYRLADIPFGDIYESLASKTSRLSPQTLAFASSLKTHYPEQSLQQVSHADLASMRPSENGYHLLTALALSFWTESPEQHEKLGNMLTNEALRADNANAALNISYAGLHLSDTLRNRLRQIVQDDTNMAYTLYAETLQHNSSLYAETIAKTDAPRWLPTFATLYDFATALVLKGETTPDAPDALNKLWHEDKALFRKTYENLQTTAGGTYQWLSLFLLAVMLREGEGTEEAKHARHTMANIAARLFDEKADATETIDKQAVTEKTWTDEMTRLKTWPPEARHSRFIFAPACIATLFGLDPLADYIISGWLTHRKGKTLNEAQRQIAACVIKVQHALHMKAHTEILNLLTDRTTGNDYADIFHILLTGDKETQSLLSKEMIAAHEADAMLLLGRDIGPKNIIAWLDILEEAAPLKDTSAIRELTHHKNAKVAARAEEALKAMS